LFEQSTQAQFLRPIVASLAFGLTGATFLALFVTPAVFIILHDLRLVRRAPAEPAAPSLPEGSAALAE
jgi:Cu/Ag efflux pump CusA